jgi:UMF1 family MFS transporter
MTEGAVAPSRRSVWSWVVYDLANTIFALGVIGRYFPQWLISVGRPDSALALVEAVAGAVVIFMAPWAGARSDVRGTRVPTLVVTTIICVAATALLASGSEPVTLILLGVALIAFNVGAVAYDALLVDVSTPANRGRISGLGVGVGYIGSFVGLGLGVLALDVLGWSYAATFRLLALAFLLLALPAFFFIHEREGHDDAPLPGIRDVGRRMISSWRLAATYDGVVPFLVGRFLYTDAINTLIGGFLTIFVLQELGLDGRFVTALLGLAIIAAIFGGLGAGAVIGRFGPLRVLRAVLVLWMVAIGAGIAAAVTSETGLAWAIGALGGLALGATWASDRVVMVRVSPPRNLGELYGLYATVGRFATILGPITWAIIVDVLGLGRRVAMGALIGFIGVGWLVLRRVDDTERIWAPADLPVVSRAPDAPPI